MGKQRVTVTIGDEKTRLLVPEKIEDEITGELRLVHKGDVIDLAIRKIYGKTCWWWADSGLGLYCGQVCQPVHRNLGGGNNCMTPRVWVTVEEGWV